MLVKSTQDAFHDSISEYNGLDVVDAPLDEAQAEMAEQQTQAMYIVINSHDVLQLTVTPTALQIMYDLSEVKCNLKWFRTSRRDPKTLIILT